MPIDPTQDGVSHINVYSKGQTELGRRLSNMADISMTHPVYGSFCTLEGFWWYLSTGMTDDTYRTLNGLESRTRGKKATPVYRDDFQSLFIEGMVSRLQQHPSLLSAVQANTLPYKHYYVYNGHVVDRTDKHQWQLTIYDQVAHPEPFRLLLAGSRHYTDYTVFKTICVDYIKRHYPTLINPSDVIIISGLARSGADDMAIRLCREMGYTLVGYPAAWEIYGKRAGMIRNTTMSKRCTHSIVFWDGQSSGSKHMIDLLVKNGIEHLIYLTTQG